MDFLSNLVPGVPSLELDPTSQYQNLTLLQETFMGAFLGTFLANLGAQTVRMILGQSVILNESFNSTQNYLSIFFSHKFCSNFDFIIF